jgi:branched-chain amino acid transport system substrate-binding protein
MTIGILFPSSSAHPNIGFDFINGIKTYLNKQQLNEDLQIVTESVGIAGTEKEVYAKAEKLLMIEGVDVLLAYIDERVLVMLQPLLYASGKLVIIVNPGANYPLNWVPQPSVIHLTLQHAFCCWLTGADAAVKEHKKALAATTFYDCGYLHAASIVKSYVKGGGSIIYNYSNKDKYDNSFGIAPLTEFLGENKAENNLLCVFDSLPASLFFTALDKSDAAQRLHLFVSPMMLEQKALENIGEGFSFSIDGYLPWQLTAQHSGNTIFIESYKQKNKKDPSMFSVLGWESAMILEHVFKNAAGDYNDGSALAETLKTISFESPRGPLQLDAATYYFLSPIGKCSIKAASNKMVVEWSKEYSNDWIAFTEEPTSGAISGWTNTYLCY